MRCAREACVQVMGGWIYVSRCVLRRPVHYHFCTLSEERNAVAVRVVSVCSLVPMLVINWH
jgi:hypothetical protein